jgi:hypothetical protein
VRLGVRCSSATVSAAVGLTREETVAATALGWSSIITILPARAAALLQKTCACSVVHTIASRLNAPTAASTSSEPSRRANTTRNAAARGDSPLHPRRHRRDRLRSSSASPEASYS